MKTIIIKFGIISGAVVSAAFLTLSNIGNELMFSSKGLIIGYTSMFLSSCIIFLGIHAYKKMLGGAITFGQAFKVGILIAVVSAAIYALAWMIASTWLYPNFMEEYSKYSIEKQKAKGLTGKELQGAIKEMAQFSELYKNPFIKIGLTFMELFPIGLLFTLISSFILKKKSKY